MTIAESTITFTDARRHARTAQLMLQQDSPRAFALIAHGFPGGEPGRVIAEGLAAAGISTLRFDCGSGDDDAVGDLMAASAYLRERHAAPTLLVGHAEGGTASLGAARRIPEVRAVVTIGAPAPQEPPKFEAALLILQASSDEEVGMEEARKVYLAARQPKSFISLDEADHLLGRPGDADYVAGLIAAWAPRYAVDAAVVQAERATLAQRPAEGSVEVHETGNGRFQQHVRAGSHVLTADEPRPMGEDTGPSPYDLLLASLGTCTSMTVRMYAERKQWPLDQVAVALRHSRIHAEDCENCETQDGKVDRIVRTIRLDGDLDDAQRARLLEIADKCPVHRTLHSETIIETRRAIPGRGDPTGVNSPTHE